MIKVNFCKGLKKLGYKIQALYSKNSFDIRFYEGTCFIKYDDIELIGNRILCLVTYFEDNSLEYKEEVFTNCYEYMDIDIEKIDIKMLQNNSSFFKSIVSALFTKIKYTDKSAFIEFASDDFKMDLKMTRTIDAKITTDIDEMITSNYDEIIALLSKIKTINKFQTIIITNKGCKKTCIIENSIIEVLRELYNFMNKTLILDYISKDNKYIRRYLFEHQVLEIKQYSYGPCKIYTYPLSKLVEEYPISISFTFSTIKSIQEKLIKDYNRRNMPIFKERK